MMSWRSKGQGIINHDIDYVEQKFGPRTLRVNANADMVLPYFC